MTATSDLAASEIAELRAALRGGLLCPGDDGYDAARAVWNGMIDRSPAVIARCAGVADVQAALGFARGHGLPVAVRGGGHNAAGLAVCDGGLVVDLTLMRGVRVDAARRSVRVQGGATWGDLDRETQVYGLATTGGAISSTGVAGLTLGGGLGWLMRSYGLVCDNLLSADLVTADGRSLTASATENADLFWGLRGGGGNFGVVTSFEFRLHAVGPVLAGMLIYPLAQAREVLRVYREFTAAAPDELTVFAVLMTTPDGMPVLALILCYNGPLEAGEAAIRPLRQTAPPMVDQVGPMPYVVLQSMLDEGFPHGLQVYWRSHFLTGLGDDAIDALLERFAAVGSPLTAVLIEQLGGAVARVGAHDTAFGHRAAPYNLAIVARWADPTQADAHIAWTRDLWEALRPSAAGVYVNYLGAGEGAERVRAAYDPGTYARLAELKRRYDPENVFRFNQNITPSA
jgi:FAD/FMN-containing dehydrogenase